MFKWDAASMNFYLAAIWNSDYPRVFIEKMSAFLQPSAHLLDIGCGPGAFALHLAPMVKKVFAMDEDPVVLKFLAATKAKMGLSNIQCIKGTWPGEAPEKIDALVSAYSGPAVLASKPSLQKMAEITSGPIFLIVPAQRYRSSFGSADLFRRQGMEMKKHTTTYTDTIRILKELDIPYNLELVSYDFGQPVADIAEGERFLAERLPFPGADLRAHVRKIAARRGEHLWLPNIRRSALIWFQGRRA